MPSSRRDDQDTLKAAHELAKYLTGSQVAKDIPGWQLAPGLRKSNTGYATNDARAVIAKLVEYGVYEAPVATTAEIGQPIRRGAPGHHPGQADAQAGDGRDRARVPERTGCAEQVTAAPGLRVSGIDAARRDIYPVPNPRASGRRQAHAFSHDCAAIGLQPACSNAGTATSGATSSSCPACSCFLSLSPIRCSRRSCLPSKKWTCGAAPGWASRISRTSSASKLFWASMQHTLVYAFFVVAAWITSLDGRWRRSSSRCPIAPNPFSVARSICPMSSASSSSRWCGSGFFEPDYGFFNYLLSLVGQPGPVAAKPRHCAVEHRAQHGADRARQRRGALFGGDGLDPAASFTRPPRSKGRTASKNWITSPSRCSSRPRFT